MKKFALSLLAISALLFPSLSHADKNPPYHLTTVSWIVSSKDNIDVDDRYVTLIGRVTKQISDGAYWFTDGTGSIRLDSGDAVLPVGEKVVIGGRIDQAYFGWGVLEVDVKQWHVSKKP
jgi:uncharacterized protein YdeI (BOF family)